MRLWERDGLVVEAEYRGRDLLISGQDLRPPFGADSPFDGDYEYYVTVKAKDLPRLVAALGGRTSDDVLELLREHAETFVTTGETTWLRTHEVPFTTFVT